MFNLTLNAPTAFQPRSGAVGSCTQGTGTDQRNPLTIDARIASAVIAIQIAAPTK